MSKTNEREYMSDGMTEMRNSINDAKPIEWDNLRSNRAKIRGSRGALDVQIQGEHYKKLKIQPVEYAHANELPFIEGCIVKYATRWREKGGLKDIEKIKHFCDLLIQLESQK
jgi:Protein of unknwon function (DUF3310)